MTEEFDWTVRASVWRPPVRPQPPFGPTVVEVLRSCPLRRCFEVSDGYERRTTFSGRIGTAVHRTLESLVREPPQVGTAADVAGEAARRFDVFLEEQRRAAARPRERGLPQNAQRSERAREAIMAEAMDHAGDTAIAHRGPGAGVPSVETEVEVRSADGLFRGFVDRAERTTNGTRLVDFKSALRGDVPERYERQVQMYAAMWADTRGEWPVAAELRYPLVGRSVQLSIDQVTCLAVMREAQAAVERVRSAGDVAQLATPGAVCQVCEFRPWCQPFWAWQRRAVSVGEAFEHAHLGFEGPVLEATHTSTVVAVSVQWVRMVIRLAARPTRFPALDRARPGATVRALDFTIQGVVTIPKALATDYSEVFLVQP